MKILFTAAIAFSFAAPTFAQSTLYVGLSNSKGYVVGAKLSESGMFRYEGDTTWAHIGWNHPSMAGLAFKDKADGVIWASAGNGGMRSLDGGKSWRITTDWRVTESQNISIDVEDRDHVYLATAYGIWLTRDGGETWAEANTGFAKKYTQAVVPDQEQSMRALAATEGGIYITENGGDNWTRVGLGIPMFTVHQSAAAPEIWLSGGRTGGVQRSTDNGETWSTVLLLDSDVMRVTIDPANPEVMAAATWGEGIWISEDGGDNWSERDGLPTRILIEGLFDANGSGRLWVATKEEGIYHTDDLGQSWAYAGMNGTMVYDMVFAE